MARNFLLFILLVSVSPPIYGATFSAVAHDAEASTFYGDFFHSFRDYSYLENEDTSFFAKNGVQGYLKSLFILGDEAFVESECQRLATSRDSQIAVKGAYLCGQHFITINKYEFAEKTLKNIPVSSHFYWPGQILLASAYLISNQPQAALDLLKTSDLPQYTEFDLADEFYLTQARAYVAENKFNEALQSYQAIGGKSNFYIETLEETAWIFFKTHRFESAQVLLDVLIGHYESAQRLGNLEVPIYTYYRARYLKAYQALAEKRTEGAAAEFSELKSEYSKVLTKLKKKLDGEAVLEEIHDKNIKWTDVHDFPSRLKDQLDLISQWMGADVAKGFENEILYQMAVSREINRAGKYDSIYGADAPGYKDKLQSLQDETWKTFSNHYADTVKKLSKDMDVIKVKAELGRLEIVWLKRAEGARSLDEVIDSYRQESRSVDELIEK